MSIVRRTFLTGLTAAGGFAALTPRSTAAEPPPETGTIRVSSAVAICTAPQLVSEDLLRAEGLSPGHGRSRSSSSGKARWTPTWGSRPSRRSCAPGRSATR
jgi:NitT/TauT family transport system substrate-binding protein